MAALELDYAAGHIAPDLVPVFDDRERSNIVIAASHTAEVTATDTDGPRGVEAIGPYESRVKVNPASDADLAQHAGHHLALRTDPDRRFSEVVVDLDANPDLATAVSAVDVGDLLALKNLPESLGRPTADVLVRGYQEILRSHRRVITFNARKGGILTHVGVLDGGATACLQTSGAQLAGAITAEQTSFLVATERGPLFTTTPPAGASIVVRDREVIPVGTVASSIRATFNGTAVSGWDTLDTGQAWVVGAGTAANFSESAGSGRIAISATNAEHHIAVDVTHARYQRVRVFNTLAVTPTGAGINWGVVLRRQNSTNLYWIDAQVGLDSSITLRVISKIAGANVQLATAVSATAHSTSVARVMVADIDDDDMIRVKLYSSDVAEPRGWELEHQASHTDLQSGSSVGCIARLMTGNTNPTPVTFSFDNFAVLNPQRFTVSRTPDERMEHPDAGGVSVYRPLRLTL